MLSNYALQLPLTVSNSIWTHGFSRDNLTFMVANVFLLFGSSRSSRSSINTDSSDSMPLEGLVVVTSECLKIIIKKD